MTDKTKQATLILFDNTVWSLNGDFSPTRFEAQRRTLEAMARHIHEGNRESIFGFGTLSGKCQIVLGLGRHLTRFNQYLDTVERSGSTIEFDRSIRSAIFALARCPPGMSIIRIVVIFAARHDLTADQVTSLAQATRKVKASVDIIVFGTDVKDFGPLSAYATEVGGESHLYRITSSINFQSSVEHYVFGGVPMDDTDVDMRMALEASMQDQGIGGGEDDELAAAIALSMEQPASPAPPPAPPQEASPEDPDLLDAIALSMEQLASPAPPPAQAEEGEDEEGPAFQAALELSRNVAEAEAEAPAEEEDDPELAAMLELSLVPVEVGAEEDNEVERQRLEDAARLSQQHEEEEEEARASAGAADGRAILEELVGEGVLSEEVNAELIALLDNPEELRRVLQTLPGVNADDPRFYAKPQNGSTDQTKK